MAKAAAAVTPAHVRSFAAQGLEDLRTSIISGRVGSVHLRAFPKEFEHRGIKFLGVIVHQDVSRALQHAQLTTWDFCLKTPAEAGRNQGIAIPPDQKTWGGDAGELIAHLVAQ
jgi:hypothetical protein